MLRSKKVKNLSLWSSERIKERLWSVFFCLFSSCTCNMERIYRGAVPKAKNEVGNQSKSWCNFNRWPPRSQKLRILQSLFPMWFDLTCLDILRFSFFFLIFSSTTFTKFGEIIIVFKESCKTLRCFWKVLVRKMIVRISRCLYHARSRHQSLRTSTIYITAFSKEKARTFYIFPCHWCYYLF